MDPSISKGVESSQSWSPPIIGLGPWFSSFCTFSRSEEGSITWSVPLTTCCLMLQPFHLSSAAIPSPAAPLLPPSSAALAHCCRRLLPYNLKSPPTCFDLLFNLASRNIQGFFTDCPPPLFNFTSKRSTLTVSLLGDTWSTPFYRIGPCLVFRQALSSSTQRLFRLLCEGL